MFANYKLLNRLPLLSLALLLACKKDETNPDNTGIRLFTNRMEITDVAVKASFLRRAPAGFRQIPASTTTDQVKFSAPDTATFGASAIKYVAVKNNGQYLFYSTSGVQFSGSAMLLYDMLKYSLPLNPYIGYATSEVRVGYDKGNQLQISYLQYYWQQPNSWYYGTLLNELNESVASKVNAADTLAVRTGSITAALVR